VKVNSSAVYQVSSANGFNAQDGPSTTILGRNVLMEITSVPPLARMPRLRAANDLGVTNYYYQAYYYATSHILVYGCGCEEQGEKRSHTKNG
jgi:hypothetical protein